MAVDVRARLRVVIADDERPARSFLAALLRSFDDVVLVSEAQSGNEAVAIIERDKPDLALLDLQMPELDGLAVVRSVKTKPMPLFAFVTAYDEYAIRAFEVNAVDYLLKPVEKARLRETLNRAHELMEHAEIVAEQASRVSVAAEMYASGVKQQAFLDRIPVRRREEVLIVPVNQIASIVAEGELLHLTTVRGEQPHDYVSAQGSGGTIGPDPLSQTGRGTLANIDLIVKLSVMPGGTHVAILSTGQRLQVSRLQSRILRERFLRL